MHWSIPSTTSIATLRCQDASNPLGDKQIWQRPHKQTGAA